MTCHAPEIFFHGALDVKDSFCHGSIIRRRCGLSSAYWAHRSDVGVHVAFNHTAPCAVKRAGSLAHTVKGRRSGHEERLKLNLAQVPHVCSLSWSSNQRSPMSSR